MRIPVRHLVNTLFGGSPFLAALLLVSAPLWAQTGTERAGLGVFGPVLGIHGRDTLVVRGNVVLDRAMVTGMGTLSLRSPRPQHIIAHQSSVRNLHLATLAGTTLHGDLLIDQTLTVDGGLLDTRAATLTLGDSARLWLRHGGQVKQGGSLLTARPGRPNAPVPPENPPAMLPANLANKLVESELKNKIGFGNVCLIGYSRPLDEPSPPPEA